jgi:hypothetical protein
MVPRNVFLAICMIASTLCLAIGYIVAGQWIWSLITIITGIIWLPARKNLNTWLPFICLFANVCLAVIGILAGSPSVLMFCGSGLALATWDLLFLGETVKNSSLEEQTRRYENKHLQSLGLALGLGLLLTFLGRLLVLQVPFVVLLPSIALFALGLDQIWGFIKKRQMRVSVPTTKE